MSDEVYDAWNAYYESVPNANRVWDLEKAVRLTVKDELENAGIAAIERNVIDHEQAIGQLKERLSPPKEKEVEEGFEWGTLNDSGCYVSVPREIDRMTKEQSISFRQPVAELRDGRGLLYSQDYVQYLEDKVKELEDSIEMWDARELRYIKEESKALREAGIPFSHSPEPGDPELIVSTLDGIRMLAKARDTYRVEVRNLEDKVADLQETIGDLRAGSRALARQVEVIADDRNKYRSLYEDLFRGFSE